MFYGLTDIGKKRKNNEDYLLAYNLDENTNVYMVLDGIGGANGGEVASKMAAEKTVEYIKEHYLELNTDDMLKLAVKYANKCVYEMAKENKEYKDMGTTIAMLFVKEDVGYHISIGDSRIYEIKDNEIMQITEDDTYVNALVKDNIISKEEAKTHPERHVILRALGVSKSVNFEVNKIDDIQNKKYLLCTDGLVVANTDEEIFEIIRISKKADVCKALIELANNKGGHDNTTVMYVEL